MSEKKTMRQGGGPVVRVPRGVGQHGSVSLRNALAYMAADPAFQKREARDSCVCPTCGDRHLNAKARERMERLLDKKRKAKA